MPEPRGGPTTGDCRSSRSATRPPRPARPLSTLHRELNALKKTDVPWMYQVSKCAPQEALWNLDAAFTHFFRRCALKKQGSWKGKLGYPRFKTKKKGLGSFRLTGRIVVSDATIVLPRLGRLRLKERGYLPTSGVAILSATVSEQAGHWYVSVQVEEEHARAREHGPGGRDRSGHQEPGDPLGWRGHCQSPAPQTTPEEAETAAAGGEPAARRAARTARKRSARWPNSIGASRTNDATRCIR